MIDKTPTLDAVARANTLSSSLLTISSLWKASGASACAALGVGFLEARVIAVLGNEPGLYAAKVAARLGVDPAAVSRTVKTLRVRELVEVDENHRLNLTETGLSVCIRITLLQDERFKRLTQGFTPRDVEQLVHLLTRLQANLSGVFDVSIDMAGTPALNEITSHFPLVLPISPIHEQEAV